MKCIRNPASGEVRREPDSVARTYVLRYSWQYISKGEYKRQQIAQQVDKSKLSSSQILRRI